MAQKSKSRGNNMVVRSSWIADRHKSCNPFLSPLIKYVWYDISSIYRAGIAKCEIYNFSAFSTSLHCTWHFSTLSLSQTAGSRRQQRNSQEEQRVQSSMRFLLLKSVHSMQKVLSTAHMLAVRSEGQWISRVLISLSSSFSRSTYGRTRHLDQAHGEEIIKNDDGDI